MAHVKIDFVGVPVGITIEAMRREVREYAGRHIEQDAICSTVGRDGCGDAEHGYAFVEVLRQRPPSAVYGPHQVDAQRIGEIVARHVPSMRVHVTTTYYDVTRGCVLIEPKPATV